LNAEFTKILISFFFVFKVRLRVKSRILKRTSCFFFFYTKILFSFSSKPYVADESHTVVANWQRECEISRIRVNRRIFTHARSVARWDRSNYATFSHKEEDNQADCEKHVRIAEKGLKLSNSLLESIRVHLLSVSSLWR